MEQFRVLLVTILAVVALSHGEHIPQLKGMQHLTITCEIPKQHSFVRSFSDSPKIDFLEMPRIINNSIDVLVEADQLQNFKTALDSQKIDYKVNIEDVEKTIAEEKHMNNRRRKRSLMRKNSSKKYIYYPRFNEIESALKALTQRHNKTTKLIEIGKSYEGRPIYVVKISSGGKNKPAIFIDAGIHAREWIAPATALCTLRQLVTNEINRKLYENVDWYILPVLNPDGYEYTHTTDRFWRKTRSRNANSHCMGTDANRNFDFKWMVSGASEDPCSGTYAGKRAFSEPETRALSNYLLAHKKTIKAYLSLHSYGQYILYPWGYTSDLPDNEPELHSLAVNASLALYRMHGTEYVVGSSGQTLRPAAGGSDDWAMAVAGIKLAYTIELPVKRIDHGDYHTAVRGFDPPPFRIRQVCIETFEAFKVFQQYVEKPHPTQPRKTPRRGVWKLPKSH